MQLHSCYYVIIVRNILGIPLPFNTIAYIKLIRYHLAYRYPLLKMLILIILFCYYSLD